MENQLNFDRIAEAIRFLQTNHALQPSLDVVAEHVHLSKFHFQRLFTEWAGVSPKQFLQLLTVEHAKKSLQRGKSTLATAYEVGLSGNGRLHDLFVKLEACSPGEFQKKGKGIDICFDEIETPFGRACVAETSKGICRLFFVENDESMDSVLKKEFPHAFLRHQLGKYGQQVQNYFINWKLPEGKIQLDLQGTDFQIQVWRALLQIPSAQLVAYQDVALRIGKPRATRAVGTAIGKNPIAYLIPCHRVIRESGAVGGYRWNIERKLAINGYEALHLG